MRIAVEKVVILCGFLVMASLEAFFRVSHAVLRLVSFQPRIQGAVVAFRVLFITGCVKCTGFSSKETSLFA